MSEQEKEQGVFAEILSSRRNIIELVIVAVFLAIGVNLLSDGIIELFKLPSLLSFLLGFLVICATLLYFLALFSNQMRKRRIIRATFCYNKNTNELIAIPEYEFSEGLIRYLQAARLEEKNIQFVWGFYPLKDTHLLADDDGEARPKSHRSMQIIREATEYFVLEALSDNLSEHFVDEKIIELDVYKRENVPDVLMRNRFLELFSRPLQEREHFAEMISQWRLLQENLEITLDDGAYYEDFQLILPKGSTISKPNPSKICIETPMFWLNIITRFSGDKVALPKGLIDYYMKLQDDDGLESFTVAVRIDVNFKPGILFSVTGVKYYLWLDTFIESLTKKISLDAFLKSINWNTSVTIIKHINTIKSSNKC